MGPQDQTRSDTNHSVAKNRMERWPQCHWQARTLPPVPHLQSLPFPRTVQHLGEGQKNHIKLPPFTLKGFVPNVVTLVSLGKKVTAETSIPSVIKRPKAWRHYLLQEDAGSPKAALCQDVLGFQKYELCATMIKLPLR